MAATQAAAGAVTGEDGLWGLIQGLIGWTHVNFQPQAGSVHKVGGCGRDVVVLVSRSELKAQGKGGEELELLGEFEGSPRRSGPVAFPALEASLPVVTGGMALAVHHV